MARTCGRTAALAAEKGALKPSARPLAWRVREQAALALRPPWQADGLRPDRGRAERANSTPGADEPRCRQAQGSRPTEAAAEDSCGRSGLHRPAVARLSAASRDQRRHPAAHDGEDAPAHELALVPR